MGDTWDPEQYHRFAAQRRQPFDDLLALVRPVPGGRVVDLGCGTGELTADLHRHTKAAETVGVDSSAAMLERAAGVTEPGVRFERGDLAAIEEPGAYDVVFANASLQWVPDHERLLPRLVSLIAPGGQLAVQVPANFDHVSHTLAEDVGRRYGAEPALGVDAVLAPERYATLLHELGFAAQHVRLQVYGHPLDRTADVVEWVKGTLLTRYREALDAARYEAFLAEYRAELFAAVGDPGGGHPYFYPFKRILFGGIRG